jgi:hypothetical protein
MVIVDMSDLNREEYTKKEWKKIYNKRYQQTEEGKEAHKRYEQSERYKEAKKHYQQSERYKEAKKRYEQSEKNKERRKRYEQSERYKEAKKHYQQSERGRTLHRARSTKRRAQKLNATVAWADENKILDIYLRAQRKTKQTGKQHAVDHFLPLQNINVCGLHCESNLRVILAKINNVKNNSFTPEIEKRVIQLMTRDQLKLKQ